MDSINDFMTWLSGIVLAFITLVIGAFKWFKSEFKERDQKINELSSKLIQLEGEMNASLASVKHEIKANSEMDQERHIQKMELFGEMNKKLEKILNHQQEQEKRIADFYYLNPTLKKPSNG